MRAASSRPHSARYNASSCSDTLRKGHDRTHFDGAEARARDLRGDGDGLVQIGRLDQVVAAQLLLRLGEGAVGSQALAVAHAHRGGRVGRLQRVAAFDLSGELLPEGAVLGELRLLISVV